VQQFEDKLDQSQDRLSRLVAGCGTQNGGLIMPNLSAPDSTIFNIDIPVLNNLIR
ncbi:MAG: hypothetical protein ACI9R8_002707, partial [Candidatus Paceibacteria bacterium]